MPNVFQYVDWLSMEGLVVLKNSLKVARNLNHDYQDDYGKEFAPGATIRVPKPFRFTIRNGMGYNPQALVQPFTTVTVDQFFGVDFEWDSMERALNMPRPKEAIKELILDPAMVQIAQEIDSRSAQFLYQNTNNIVGALGTTPTTMATYQAARQRMRENACPPGEIFNVLSPAMQTSIANALATVFNPQKTSDEAFMDGYIGEGAGAKWWESMSLFQHTAGTWAGAVTTTGAGQSGSQLIITATGGDTFKKGDVINIAAVNNINPITRRSTGTLAQFVITQDFTAAGGGADVINIAPAIVGPGDPNQNVDALPGALAALTLFPGTTNPNGKVGTQGLYFNKYAAAIVGVRLELPKAVELSSQAQDPETGLAVRFVRQWDNIQSRMTNRFDVLFGFGGLYPANASVRVQSAN